MTTKKESKAKRLGNVPKVAWSLDELASATGLSYAGLRREVRAGNLKTIHVGRRCLVMEEDRLSWLASKSLPKAG
jgi:hypothetical protein